ncbi:MAG: hypothetical protein P1P89_13385 [Desulfobacterales bacterium]|nr:hypothetical protein [Desulfobacterales bacterium]
METIHLKTVDPVSQELLRLAAKNGIALNWDRYEKLQPQDGFLRLGLSCPFGCLQGPCRIDPFGRGPDRGLCGMDRDAMVAAMLLRICLQGTLTILNDIALSDAAPTVSFAPGLKKSAAKAIKGVAPKSLSTAQIFKSAALLQRPADPFGVLLEQTLVLSLLAVGLLGQQVHEDKGKDRTVQAGYGVLSGGHVTIAIAGQPPRKLVEALGSAAAGKSGASVRLVSLGDWIPAAKGYLPLACSSAEAELLLSARAIHFLVAGAGADPGVIETAAKMDVPVARAEDKSDAAKILKSARQFHSHAPRPEITFESHLMEAGVVTTALTERKGSTPKKPKSRFALLGGSDSLHYPLGHLPVALAMALRGAGIQVAGWGDAAVWMMKNGLTSKKASDPVSILDPQLGPLQFAAGLSLAGKPDRLKGILFIGGKDCRDLPVALGLALLGCKVAFADPIPFWGSSSVRDRLSDLLAANGGQLTGFDHPAEAQELLEWFTK